MSNGPDEVDELVKDWYDRQAMSGARAEAIARLVRQTRPRAWHRPRFVAAAAAVILTCGIVSLTLRTQGRATMLAVASEVAGRQGTAFVPATTRGSANELAAVEGLDFRPVVPERCRREKYTIVGVRRAVIDGEPAAEIRVLDDEGVQQTLCEMAGTKVGGARDGRVTVDGVVVSVWHEGGLVMAMTGD